MYNISIDKEQEFYASINPKLFKKSSLEEKVDFLFENNYFHKEQKIYIFLSSKNTITDLIYPENPYFEFYWFLDFKGQTYHINEKILEEYYEYIKDFVKTIMSDHLLYETQFLSKLKLKKKKEKYLLKTYKKHVKLFYKNSLHELFTDERKMCGGFTGIEDYIKTETPETLFNFLTYESLKNPNALDNGIISDWARIVEINHILLLCSKELKKINYPDLFVPVEDPLSMKEMVSFGFRKIDENFKYEKLTTSDTITKKYKKNISIQEPKNSERRKSTLSPEIIPFSDFFKPDFNDKYKTGAVDIKNEFNKKRPGKEFAYLLKMLKERDYLIEKARVNKMIQTLLLKEKMEDNNHKFYLKIKSASKYINKYYKMDKNDIKQKEHKLIQEELNMILKSNLNR